MSGALESRYHWILAWPVPPIIQKRTTEWLAILMIYRLPEFPFTPEVTEIILSHCVDNVYQCRECQKIDLVENFFYVQRGGTFCSAQCMCPPVDSPPVLKKEEEEEEELPPLEDDVD